MPSWSDVFQFSAARSGSRCISLIIIIIFIIYSLRDFHISAIWCFLTEVWVAETHSSLQDSSQYFGRPQ